MQIESRKSNPAIGIRSRLPRKLKRAFGARSKNYKNRVLVRLNVTLATGIAMSVSHTPQTDDSHKVKTRPSSAFASFSRLVRRTPLSVEDAPPPTAAAAFATPCRRWRRGRRERARARGAVKIETPGRVRQSHGVDARPSARARREAVGVPTPDLGLQLKRSKSFNRGLSPKRHTHRRASPTPDFFLLPRRDDGVRPTFGDADRSKEKLSPSRDEVETSATACITTGRGDLDADRPRTGRRRDAGRPKEDRGTAAAPVRIVRG